MATAKEPEGAQSKEPEAVPDYSAFEIDFVFPFTKYSKKEIKSFKIPSRRNPYLLVCEVCSVGLMDEKAANQHIESKYHKLYLQEHALDEQLSNLPELSSANINSISQFVEATYTDKSALANGQLEVRDQIVEQLQSFVQKEFKDVTAQLHGSSLSRFAVVSSDVNINLDIPASLETQQHIPVVMKRVTQILKDNADVYVNVKPDYYSFNKIPRILFQHRDSQLLCEIRAMAGNPMMLAPILRCYSEADVRVVKLAVSFTSWVKTCYVDAQENGHYPGHMFVVMVIHFLQQRPSPVVPVLHEVMPELRQKKQGEGEESGGGKHFFTEEELEMFVATAKSWKSENKQSVGELWIEMLRYYCFEVDWSKVAVSIRQLAPLQRESRQWGAVRLAVEDPMIPKNNLARAATCDNVYLYYITSLKKTTVYFYSCLKCTKESPQNKPAGPQDNKPAGPQESAPTITGNNQTEVHAASPTSSNKETAEIEREDSSIVSARANTETSSPRDGHSSKTQSTSLNKSSLPGQQSTPSDSNVLVDNDLSELLPKLSFNKYEEPDIELRGPPIPDNTRNHETIETPSMTTGSGSESRTAVNPLTAPADGAMAEIGVATTESKRATSVGKGKRARKRNRDKGGSKPVEAAAVLKVKTPSQKPKEVSVLFKLSLENCVIFHPYPKACVSCKQSKHVALECPSDVLPNYAALLSNFHSKNSCLLKLGKAFKLYMMDVNPTEQDRTGRKHICELILKDIQSIYPSARIQLFGSSCNGFGSYMSDLDICLILNKEDNKEPQGEKSFNVEVIDTVAKQLRKNRDKFRNVISITSARVPIVKFYLPQWKLECDISMENQLAMRNTRMLAAYADIDERVRILVYAVKYFAKVCDIGDASSGSLSSYAYTLMMLHYLQRTTPPVIPVLQKLHPAKGKMDLGGATIDNWDCYFFRFDDHRQLQEVWSDYKANKQNVGDLWLGFLTYFLKFDWSEQVIVTNKLELVSKFDKWWMAKQMCIEDPFNLHHNLTASVSGRMRLYILERFHSALVYHSTNTNWQNIDNVMIKEHLVGKSRPPKFMLCDFCNKRGHKAAMCPAKADQERKQKKEKSQPTVPSSTSKVSSTPVSGTPKPPLMSMPSKDKGPLLLSPAGPSNIPSHPGPANAYYQPMSNFPYTAVPVVTQRNPLLQSPPPQEIRSIDPLVGHHIRASPVPVFQQGSETVSQQSHANVSHQSRWSNHGNQYQDPMNRGHPVAWRPQYPPYPYPAGNYPTQFPIQYPIPYPQQNYYPSQGVPASKVQSPPRGDSSGSTHTTPP